MLIPSKLTVRCSEAMHPNESDSNSKRRNNCSDNSGETSPIHCLYSPSVLLFKCRHTLFTGSLLTLRRFGIDSEGCRISRNDTEPELVPNAICDNWIEVLPLDFYAYHIDLWWMWSDSRYGIIQNTYLTIRMIQFDFKLFYTYCFWQRRDIISL